MANPKVADGGALEEAVVRRGTVYWGAGPWDGSRDDHNPPAVRSGPGEKVRLPRDEVARLRAMGVLHDPQTPEIPVGLGPNFNVEDGVQVAPTPSAEPAPAE